MKPRLGKICRLCERILAPKLWVIALIFALSSAVLTAAIQSKEIVIKSSSTAQKAVLIEAELKGKPVELTCILTASNCKKPAKGRYLAALLSKDDGEYKDCTNIGVYRIAPNGYPGEKVGNYCLLSEWIE